MSEVTIAEKTRDLDLQDGNDDLKMNIKVIKFTRKPAKMGEDHIFWIPRVYIKEGLVDPSKTFLVYMKDPQSNSKVVQSIKFTRKPAKMGEDHIFWIPRLYIKNGLVNPETTYQVFLVEAGSNANEEKE